MGADIRSQFVDLNATLNLQCKVAIVRGGAWDHAGKVQVQRLVGFDMDRTVFAGL